jgi:nitrite reductase/ring-hydroxylating ferredoxin subunit
MNYWLSDLEWPWTGRPARLTVFYDYMYGPLPDSKRAERREADLMPGWIALAKLSELPPGATKEVEHDGRIYALFNVDGEISAIDGICPHQGGPLAEGDLDGTIVTCPWHGWQFDVRTGQSTFGGRIRQPTFEVKVEGDDILVAVP